MPEGPPYNINAHSQPDYDDWEWDDYWNCADWIKYHQELKKTFGAEVAKNMWRQAWEAQDGTSNPYNWCKYNSEFYDYFKKELGETWFLMEIGGAITSVTETAGTTAKVLKVAIPVAAVLLIAGGIYWGYNKYLKKGK